MNTAAIQSAIYTWMQRETNITCIFARQAKPRPKPPYGTILIINNGQKVGGRDEIRVSGTQFSQAGLREIFVSLNIKGEDANAKMNDLLTSLDRPDVIEEFELAGLAHTREEGPNDLTELEDTKYLERSQLDLFFYYAKSDNIDTEYIEETQITGETYAIEEDDDTKIMDVDFTIE